MAGCTPALRALAVLACLQLLACDASLLLTPTGCGKEFALRRPTVPLWYNRGLTEQAVHASLPTLHASLFCASSVASNPEAPRAAATAFMANLTRAGAVASVGAAGSLLALVPGNAAVRGLFANMQLSLDNSTLPLVWVPIDGAGAGVEDMPAGWPVHPRSKRVNDPCLVAQVAAATAQAGPEAAYSGFFQSRFHHYALVKWRLASKLVPALAPPGAGASPSWLLVLDPDLVGFGDPTPHLARLLDSGGPATQGQEPPCDVYFQADAAFSAWALTSPPLGGGSPPLFSGVLSPQAPEYAFLRSSLREAQHNGLWGVGSTYGLLNTGMSLWAPTQAAANLSAAALAYMEANLAHRGPGPGVPGKAPRAASRQWHAMDDTALRPGHNLDDQTLFNALLSSMYRTEEEIEASEPAGEASGSTLKEPLTALVTFLRQASARRCVTLHRRQVGKPHFIELPPGTGHPLRSLGDAGPFEPQRTTESVRVPLWAPLEVEEDPRAFPAAAAATAAARAALAALPSRLRVGVLPPAAFTGRLAMELSGMCHAGNEEEGAKPTHPVLVHYNWLAGTAKKAAMMVADGAWHLDGQEVPR